MIAGAAVALASPAIARAQGAGTGVALVIGNSKYTWEAPLPNVRRDAPDIAKRFQALGLRTELAQDLGRDALSAALKKFESVAAGAKLAAFYFAGHGVITEGTQFLVPTDSDLGNPASIEDFKFAAVFRVVQAMAGAQHRLLMLDCCRNNPSDGWRQQAAAEMASSWSSPGAKDPPETLVLFSTAPGRTALDGPPGENSPFAATFLHQFEAPSVDLQAMPVRMRRDLLLATEGRQVLTGRNSFSGPFVIAGVGSAGPAAPRRGWSNDSARIIEFDKAYASADELRLPLMRGLIAHRPPAGSRDAHKVGTFRFNRGPEPAIVLVLSVEEQRTAELFITTRRLTGGQAFWTFTRGTLSGDSLEFMLDGVSARHVMKWSDANSGSVSIIPVAQSGRILNSRFTRLDG